MTERFGRNTPRWLRRWLLAGFVLAYVLILAVGLIGITWPSAGLAPWQWVMARICGAGAALGALIAGLSFPARRWQWEMFASLIAGVSLAGYVLVISMVAPFASRGLLLGFATLTVVGVFIRFLDLVARASRWADARRAGMEYDQTHGE